ncbi:MAG TPA: diguanylate cyclase [Solirubrobacterales bacterium]|jgi:diguanylate cyclase (GGDEF)-like protein
MRLRFWLGLVAVFLVATGSIAVALAVRANDYDNFHRLQREQAVRAARQAEAVTELSVGQLASAVAFYQSTGNISAHEFDLIAAPLLDQGALNGTAFVQRVPNAERRRFELERAFPITERGLGGQPRRAGGRPVHFPVVDAAAAENQVGASPPLGYDVSSDPIRAPYLHRAGRSGKPVATPALPLLTGGSGINVYLPVYRDRAPTATPAERQGALIGFAAGAFRIDDLAAVTTAAVSPTVEVQLQEQGEAIAGATEALDDPASAPIKVADRTWMLVIRDPSRPGIGLPLLIAVFGVLLAALLGALVVIWSRNEQVQELQREVSQDPLTGLKNRRRFEEDLRTELARSQRDRVSGALLMLDLDNFKQVNDTLGHSIGDRVIEEIADVLQGRMRETDVLARLGGDEFAIVLPRCDATEAQGVAEAIATGIREHVPHKEGVPPITASIGIAMFGAGSQADLESVMADADAAMYGAKAAGRDAVRLSALSDA